MGLAENSAAKVAHGVGDTLLRLPFVSSSKTPRIYRLMAP